MEGGTDSPLYRVLAFAIEGIAGIHGQYASEKTSALFGTIRICGVRGSIYPVLSDDTRISDLPLVSLHHMSLHLH